jgi:hypothetical protein
VGVGGSATNGRKREESGDLGGGARGGRFIGRRADVGRPMGDPRAPTPRVMLTQDARRGGGGSPFGAFRVSFRQEKRRKIIAPYLRVIGGEFDRVALDIYIHTYGTWNSMTLADALNCTWMCFYSTYTFLTCLVHVRSAAREAHDTSLV